MLKYIENATDYIGHHGPIIICIITSAYLLYVAKYIYFGIFCVGFYLNMCINSVLKDWIKQPRPSNQVPYIDDAFKGAHIYGMPSGHAEMCFYSIVFLWLALSSSLKQFSKMYGILILSIAISMMTLYQRWKFRRHTIEQLAVGSFVGGIVGYSMYQFANYLYVFNLQ